MSETTAITGPLAMNSAEALLSQAIAAGAGIDTLERLMALRKEVLAEKAREAFNAAMAAFQAECPVIEKTKAVKTNGGGVAYKYAPIEDVVEQVKGLIEKHGFRYGTTMKLNEARDLVKVFCRVVHKLGHEEVSEMEVPLGGKTAIMSQSQQVAAASTFAKRYAFLNAFGIMTGDEDNDAAKQEEPRPMPVREDLNAHGSAQQVTEIATLCKDLGQDVKALYAHFKITSQPTKQQALGLLDALRKRKEAKARAPVTGAEAPPAAAARAGMQEGTTTAPDQRTKEGSPPSPKTA